ncbi:hypothetical protein ABFG95_05940 [Achromobacter sp. HNDS-1]|jgi:hypothetical protein|uniref:Phage protein n=1 Tax=Achromobacter sp. HNDS-1 TaxID=3151598 RepID=A0AAU7LDT5_9BURK|nr:hypothetical protein [Achromobacter ruhlandii]MCI1839182.1 hypothetical protein [Achromobacter ruhlandii]
MTNHNNAAQAANENPLSDEYVNEIIQRHGYDSPEAVMARLAQWIGLHGGENGVTLLMYEAHKALSKLRGPVGREAQPAAYLTLDEEGSPTMLFFDVVEARSYCALGEEPEPLYRCPAPAAGDALTAAARDVLAERQRQISAEGWTPEQDDRYTHGDMASAAACYANQGRYHFPEPGKPGPNWPWAAEWWKPSTYRRNLEKAGALILAEIERLDRAAAITAHKRDE